MSPAILRTTSIAEGRGESAKSETTQVKKFSNAATRHYLEVSDLHGTEQPTPAKYPKYLPTWSNEIETGKYPPLELFEHYEHGSDADPTFHNLLAHAETTDLTGNTGTEIRGVQLSSLKDAAKDELALFVAEKKVVVFHDQDFADLPIEDVLKFGGYFGRHHIHPTSGAPKGYPEVHLVHREINDSTVQDVFEEKTNSISWHSDVSYEKQPPGTTFLYFLEGPIAGGDTLFSNQVEAYKRLSPEFQRRLHGLKVVHSAIEQAEDSKKRGGIVRRDAVTSIHPLVRTHPATGEKALYINPQFSRRIVGFKKEESDFLLNFLYDHIAKGHDFQVRVKWAPGTVVVWDNRVTAHTALVDWNDGARRHLARITPQAEVPYETEFEDQKLGGFEY